MSLPGQSEAVRTHECYAIDCEATCPAREFMCLRHWRMVPTQIRTRMRKLYRAGQEAGYEDPSPEWVQWAKLARIEIRKHEAAIGASQGQQTSMFDS